MSLILSGTDGLSDVDGSAATAEVIAAYQAQVDEQRLGT